MIGPKQKKVQGAGGLPAERGPVPVEGGGGGGGGRERAEQRRGHQQGARVRAAHAGDGPGGAALTGRRGNTRLSRDSLIQNRNSFIPETAAGRRAVAPGRGLWEGAAPVLLLLPAHLNLTCILHLTHP